MDKIQVKIIEKTYSELEYHYYTTGLCPRCNQFLYSRIAEFEEVNFCPKCGQELEWPERANEPEEPKEQ